MEHGRSYKVTPGKKKIITDGENDSNSKTTKEKENSGLKERIHYEPKNGINGVHKVTPGRTKTSENKNDLNGKTKENSGLKERIRYEPQNIPKEKEKVTQEGNINRSQEKLTNNQFNPHQQEKYIIPQEDRKTIKKPKKGRKKWYKTLIPLTFLALSAFHAGYKTTEHIWDEVAQKIEALKTDQNNNKEELER